jgi:hypothetical protein
LRTRFLGNIASPIMSASPIKVVQDLWGGELPTFDAIEEANELIGALVMGLWNRLTRHQEQSSPFRPSRMEVAATRPGLAALALMRCQELDGFIDGLFGREEMIDLPKRAHCGLDELGQMPALFGAVAALATDDAKPATDRRTLGLPARREVIAVGPGPRDESGKLVPPPSTVTQMPDLTAMRPAAPLGFGPPNENGLAREALEALKSELWRR